MKRTPVKIISISAGNFPELLYKLARQRKSIIEQRVSHWNKLTSQLFKGKKIFLSELETGFLKISKKICPAYVEEIRAMSEGCGIPFDDVFRLNMTELRPFSEKCTTVIHPVQQSIQIAHNEDWDPKRNDVFILKGILPDVRFLLVAYDGYLPSLSCGFNSHGLYHAMNYVPSWDYRIGTPRIFSTRFLVTAKSINESINFIKKLPRAFGQSLHLAEKNKYVGLELSAKKMVVRKAKPPLAHANHYLEKTLAKYSEKPSPSSYNRQKRAAELLKKNTEALILLSDTKAKPYSIWREGNQKEDSSATLVTAVMNTNSKILTVYRKRPADDLDGGIKINLNDD